MQNLELWFANKETSLSVRSFSVVEEMSALFDVSVVALSPDEDLDLDGFIGHGAGFALTGLSAWAGLVSHMEQVGVEASGLSTYYVRIVPSLFRTTQRKNCRIYQHLSVPEIAERLLAEWEIEPLLELDATAFPKLEYRVQYGETDFAFLSRLLEEAGISYFFRAEDGATSSRLVLAGDPAAAAPRPSPLRYVNALEDSTNTDVVSAVRLVHEARPGRLTVRDFDFRQRPDFALMAEARAAAKAEERNEVYQYLPGAFLVEPGGGQARVDEREAAALATRRLDGVRHGRRRVAFQTTAFDLATSAVFSIQDHPRGDLAKELLLVSRRVEGTNDGKWKGAGEAVFSDDPFHPALRTPKPRMGGLQSAFVVGPPGEEIHTDELGRVRVQFHWDREGKRDDRSSCWIRVSQAWAGRGFGFVSLPRVGQEVLVDFFEGDPDQPVVVGRVYNGTARPPYKLPEHRDKSTWKSDSYPGSGGSNELTFEDAAGHERIYVHAQKDHVRVVREAEKITIGTSLETAIGDAETHKVGADLALEVGGTRTVKIAGDDVLEVTGELHLQVGGTGATLAPDRIVLSTGAASITLAGGDIFFDASGAIKLSAGAVASVCGSSVQIDGGPNVLINTAGLSVPSPMPLLAKGASLLEHVLGESEKTVRSFTEPLFAELPGGFDEVALEDKLKKLGDELPSYVMMPKHVEEQLEDQAKKALDAAGAVASDLKDKLLHEKEKLEAKAKELAARAGETLEELKGKVKGAVEDLRARAEAAKQMAVQKFEEMKAKVEAAKAEAKAKLDELKGKFEQLKAEAKAKIDEIKARIDAAKQKLVSAVQEVREKAQQKLDELKQKLEDAKAGAKEKLDQIKQKIEDAKAAAKAKLDEMKQRLEDLKEQAKAKFEEMKAKAKELVDLAKEQLEAAKAGVAQLKQTIEDAKEQVKQKVQELKGQVEEIKAQAKAMVEDLKAQAKAVVDEVKNTIEGAKQQAKQLLEDVKSEAKALFADAKETLKGLKQDVKDAVAEVKKDVKDAVAEVKKDLKDAVAEAKKGAKDALEEAKKGAKDALADAKKEGKDLLEEAKQAASNKPDAPVPPDPLQGAMQKAGQAPGGAGAGHELAGPLGSGGAPSLGGAPQGQPLGAIVSRGGGLTGGDVAGALNQAKGPTFLQSPGEGQLLVVRGPNAGPLDPSALSRHVVDAQMNGVPTSDAFADALSKNGFAVYERPWGQAGEAFVKKGPALAMEAA